MTFFPLPVDPSGAVRMSEVQPPETKYTGPEAIIAAAQNFTDVWVELGPEIPTAGCTHLGIWLDLAINNSNDMRIKALAKHTAAGPNEYDLPIRVLSATDVKVEPGYIEFNQDANQKVLMSVPLDGVIPFIQFQIKVGTLGAPTAAQVVTAYTTKAWAGAGGGF